MFSCLSPDGNDKDDGRYARSRLHRLGEHRPIDPGQQTGLQPPESDASRLQPQFAEQKPGHYSRLAAATRLPVAGSLKALSAWSTWNTSQDPPAQRCWPKAADQSKPSRRRASSSSPTPSSSANSGKGTGCLLSLDTYMGPTGDQSEKAKGPKRCADAYIYGHPECQDVHLESCCHDAHLDYWPAEAAFGGSLLKRTYSMLQC